MTKTTFYNFTLFDGTGDTEDTDSWMTIDDETGKIIDKGKGDAPQSDQSIDLEQQFVMPGFINVHCHITSHPDMFNGGGDESETESAIFALQSLRQLLKSGVTFVRECGTRYDIDIKLKRMMDNGSLTHVPNLLPSGRAFSMTGGHGDGPHSAYLVDSPDEMRKSVRQNLKNGAKIIKMMATGGVMTPNDYMEDPQLSVEEMRAGILEAHHKGLKVAAHAEGNPGIQNAIDAGVDSIEHGFYVTEDEAQQMIDKGIFLTPTLNAELAIPEEGTGILPDWEVAKAQNAIDDTYNNLKKAFKMGVKFTCGTDAGTPFNGFDKTPRECELLTRVGMSPAEAYRCSSINSATLCGIQEERGTLEIGKFADFQVLREDPLADVKAVQQEDKAVYLNGKREF
ncbi:amidohydrolase family protein [Lentilactobacillus sp. Marseille-Q4993]|uniref:metal-dependent hydrolase family protein n=1 Tax=Lentilactobacillus sp. Marseille-Q4993 TaxID=3039492 RepID=UPI0024BCED57|nr:amidohydrolase family protein [Lentilactobacillus sp. Marseille-Q4993]